MTQAQMYYRAEQRSADGIRVMLDLLYGDNPISDDELRALIAKRPAVYSKFSAYLGTRPERTTLRQSVRLKA